ncbi:hypothetical protein ACLOJK_027998 [Asimina triloba]
MRTSTNERIHVASLASSIVGAGPNTTLVSRERRRERDTWKYNPRRRGEKEGERYRGIRPSSAGREGERERIRGKEREIWRREVWRKRQRVQGEENGREGVRASGYLLELRRERRPSYDAKSERDETECEFRSLSELERERCPCEMVESERDKTEPELGCLPEREREGEMRGRKERVVERENVRETVGRVRDEGNFFCPRSHVLIHARKLSSIRVRPSVSTFSV